MENHNVKWVNPLYMAIFNSYVKLPEGSIKKLLEHKVPRQCQGNDGMCNDITV